MSEIPATTPEKKEALDDNARKFTLDDLSPEFLREQGAIGFLLTTDWLEVGETSEKKVVSKKYDDGTVDMLLIQKFTDENGNRTVPPKDKLEAERYGVLANQSVRNAEKLRYEFDYLQGDTRFTMKYDEFVDSDVRILEVDAMNEEERASFDPLAFPVQLVEVTGDLRYYGYRVTEIL